MMWIILLLVVSLFCFGIVGYDQRYYQSEHTSALRSWAILAAFIVGIISLAVAIDWMFA